MTDFSNNNHYDVVIVGAGPAGLSAAMQADQRNLSYMILESGPEIAGTIQAYSKGKWVMAEPTALPLRSPLPFDAGSRESVLEQWQQSLDKTDLSIRYNSQLSSIQGEKGDFYLRLKDKTLLKAAHIVLAFGVQGNPNTLNCKGADKANIIYHLPVDTELRNQQILVVGAGDSAIEDAITLSEYNQVTLINRGEGFAKAKAGNRAAITKALQKRQLHCLFQTQISDIHNVDNTMKVVLSEQGETTEKQCETILVRIGAKAPRAFLETLGLAFPNQSAQATPIVSPHNESSVSGIYVTGSLAGQSLIKQAINQGYNCIEHLRGTPASPVEFPIIRMGLIRAGININAENFLHFFTQHTLFKGVDKASIIQLLSHIDLRNYQRSEAILQTDEYSDYLQLIYRGTVAIESRQQASAELTTGHMLGELALLSQQPSPYSATAKAGTIIVSIPYHALVKVFENYPQVQKRLYQQYLYRLLNWVLAPTAPAQLIKLMVSKAESFHWQSGDIIAEKNQPVEWVHFLVNGAAAYYQNDKPSLICNSGENIGLMKALEEAPIRQQAKVIQSPTRSIAISSEAIRALTQTCPELTANAQALFQQQQHRLLSQRLVSDGESGMLFYEAQQLANATDVLTINKDLCVGCDNCETACASTHSDGISRLRRRSGVMYKSLQIPDTCRHCKTPACLSDCPANAISRLGDGSINISDSCIGCGNCASECPFDVIELANNHQATWLEKINPFATTNHQQAMKAVKCDLCSERKDGPACVQACPTGAAKRVVSADLIDLINVA